MNQAIDLFSDLNDFTSYVDGFMPDTTYQQLKPSIQAATFEIKQMITMEAYDVLFSLDITDDLYPGKDFLKTAVATGATYRYSIFAAIKKNGSDASMYKYQYEEVKRHHIDAFWSAMDALLSWLDEHAMKICWTGPKGKTCYAETTAYVERQQLPVRSAVEFDYYYGIDKSSYFFSKVQFLVRNIWLHHILPVIRDTKDERILDLAKRSLCYQVMARAVMMFDVTELPRSIRYDFNHEYTKGSQMQSRDKLNAQLMAEVESMKTSIDNLLAAAAGSSAIRQNLNNESNRHYTML